MGIAVRDVSDDVRRNAVTMIGFLTFKDPSLCVDMTRVLADSYNPHIRYGVAMALAVAASGAPSREVVDMLWTLKDDLVDFVRQGAFIALSLVLVQSTEQTEPKVKELRQLLAKKIADRKEDTCTKFGCIIATGLLDAGGRNCTIQLHKQRHRLDKSVVGMFVFTQHWYWFPYTLMISLAMHPTCFIGLNEDLEMPKYSFTSNAPPSHFSIPKSVQQEKKEAKVNAQQQRVVLSTTKKDEELRERKKNRGLIAEDSVRLSSGAGDGTSAAILAEGLSVQAEDKKVSAEPNSEVLENPARVTMQQFLLVSHDLNDRYKPLKPNAFGVCMLMDTTPDASATKELVAAINPMERDETAPLPDPFTWP
jgi:26S proteasome regulatory subunit N2